MTIPALGHCAGTEPSLHRVRSKRPRGCVHRRLPGLFGQVPLHPSGAMALHEAAEIDQREVLDSPSAEEGRSSGFRET